jgi:hypothetical protein
MIDIGDRFPLMTSYASPASARVRPGRVATVAGVASDTNNALLLLDGLTR